MKNLRRKLLMIPIAAALTITPVITTDFINPTIVQADEVNVDTGSYQYTGEDWIYNWNNDTKSLTISNSADAPVNTITWSAFGTDAISQIKKQTVNITFTGVALPSNCNTLFNSYNLIEEIDLSGANFDGVTSTKNMFNKNTIKKINLENANTVNVTDMSNMFANCSNLSDLNISGINTSSVTNMSYMFSNCYVLDNIDLSNFDTSLVTNMSYMFNSCDIVNLDLSNFSTSKVTDYTGMFQNMSKLETLDISNFVVSDSAKTSMFGSSIWNTGNKNLDIIKCPKTIKTAIQLPYVSKYNTSHYYNLSDNADNTIYTQLTEVNQGTEVRVCRKVKFVYDLDNSGCAFFPRVDTGVVVTFWDLTVEDLKVGETINVMDYLNEYNTSDCDLITASTYTTDDAPISNVDVNFKTKEYTVRFLDYDGNVLKTETVKIHNSATAPSDPVRSADENYNYTFTGWDKNYQTITSSIDVIAQYKAEPKPTEPTPIEPTPVEPTPIEPTPVEPTPVEPTPIEPTPVEPTPVEPTPVEPTPVEPTPIEPTPVVQAPKTGDINDLTLYLTIILVALVVCSGAVIIKSKKDK